MSENQEVELFKRKLNLIDLENYLRDYEQAEIPIVHEFMGGVYVRSIFVPKGTLIIGKRHRLETCNLLLVGEISIYMGEKIPVKRMKGPTFFKSEPFAKKMGYAHTDLIFINLHPTESKDLEEIEKQFIIPEEEYLQLTSGGEPKCLG